MRIHSAVPYVGRETNIGTHGYQIGKLGRLVAAFGATLLSTGCSQAAAPDGQTSSIFTEVLAEARAGGANEAQINILEQAEVDGQLSLEDARRAARSAVDCMTEAGLEATYQEEASYSGTPLPGYLVVTGDDTSSIESCDVSHSLWVGKLHQLQPSSIQANEAYADQQESSLRACLEAEGLEVDENASGSQLANLASSIAQDCLFEVGIDAW